MTILILFYIFFISTSSVFAVGERSISIGAASGWGQIERQQDIIEASLIRPNPVLVLNSQIGTMAGNDNHLDAYLSFDEESPGRFADKIGNYDIVTSPQLSIANVPWSRVGAGAALFNGRAGMPSADTTASEAAGGALRSATGEALVLLPQRGALFASGATVTDFSLEFWLYPQNLETGEQILYWHSSRRINSGGFENQGIQANVSRNRLIWTFDNFFLSPCGNNSKNISFTGPLLLNRTWSHHLIRFDADLGLLEYLVDGRLEVVEYATLTGREGGEVFKPLIGEDPRMVLGGRFTGMIDEFRIHRNNLDTTRLTRYPEQGGRIETQPLDMGRISSRVHRIELFGGRTGIPRTSNFNGTVRNEYAGNSPLRFSDHSEISLYIRTSNHRYLWNDIPWIPVNSGAVLSETIRGRFVQIAADFYPSGDGETSPYLSEIKMFFHTTEPPNPPSHITAIASDGSVELSWRPSHSRNLEGYLVFFGTAKGEYFGCNGTVASENLLDSPIDVGNQTSLRIEGLRNGTLYYFAVAAYEMIQEPGEFSREVASRPLRKAD